MNLLLFLQLCLSIFILTLSILKYVQFGPYLSSTTEKYGTIIALLSVNAVIALFGVVKKGMDYKKQFNQYHDVIGIASMDFLFSSVLVGINAYGLTIEEYRWIGCVTSVVCRNLSAYSWYTIAELITASVIALYSFYSMINIRCNKSQYPNFYSQDVESA